MFVAKKSWFYFTALKKTFKSLEPNTQITLHFHFSSFFFHRIRFFFRHSYRSCGKFCVSKKKNKNMKIILTCLLTVLCFMRVKRYYSCQRWVSHRRSGDRMLGYRRVPFANNVIGHFALCVSLCMQMSI